MFYLGTHKPCWLGDARFCDVPLFVSRRRLTDMTVLPRAVGKWALDSGGFTELQMFGRWTVSEEEYIADVRRFRDEIGGLVWAAPQDWMCEPIVIAGGRGPGGSFVGTGLDVAEHQKRTVANFVSLREKAPDLPFAPVLQGWTLADYWRCADLYRDSCVDLTREPVVGIGTMCRRQDTQLAKRILASFSADGIRLHGFGFKIKGLLECASLLSSADSLAWSFTARRRPPLPGHESPGPGRPKGHKNCANCADYALAWFDRISTETLS
jgi:hypothetical protein